MGHALCNGTKGSQTRWAAGRMGEQEQLAWQTDRRGWWEGGKMGWGGGKMGWGGGSSVAVTPTISRLVVIDELRLRLY